MKGLKQITLAGLVILMTIPVMGQDDDKNLIRNPGFEIIDGRMKRDNNIDEATYWFSPTPEEADLYSRSAKSDDLMVPKNMQGDEEPFEGDSYAGVRAYAYNDKYPRTYISTELLGPLKKGIKYCVSFKLSLSDRSKYATAAIGAHMSKKPFEIEEEISITDVETHVHHSQWKVFNLQYNWESVCTIYEANGGEKYITIGNFMSNRETERGKGDYERLKKPRELRGPQTYDAYYYIDDVQVFLLDSVEECQCEQTNEGNEKVVIYSEKTITKKDPTFEELVEYSTAFFARGSDELTDNAQQNLTLLAEALKENSGEKLVVHGHSDQVEVEDAKTNPLLKYMADKRVNAVVEFLKEKGIDESRLIRKIHNAEEPASDQDTPLGHARNRRVTFTIQK